MLNRLLGLPDSASQHGIEIDSMLEFLHWFMLVLFVGWTLFFIYALIRFRRSRNPQANYYGARTKATTHLEVSVVLIEAVLLLGFAFPIWAKRVNSFPVKEGLRVRVIGQQFVWNFHYPGADGVFGRQDLALITADNFIGLDRTDPAAKDDIVTLNDLHLPVNQPAILELHSKDVIHNLAIGEMRAQHDAIPGTMIPMWFTPTKAGEYEIVCAQLCGLGHYSMRATLNIVTQEEYGQWLQAKAAALPQQPAPAAKPQLPPASAPIPDELHGDDKP
jgi:cytochrome c oxidase subunit II